MLKKLLVRWTKLSKYTTTLRFISESSEDKKEEVINTFTNYELSDYLTQSQIETIENVGNWTKRKLAEKIVRYYYFREIGFETWGLFKHFAKIEMEMLMEKYLPLIYSRAIEYDPLVNVDYSETYTSTATGNNTSQGSSESTSNSRSDGSSKYSDTPNVGLDNISSGKYLTNVTLSDTGTDLTGNTQSNNTSTSSNTNDYTKRIKGNSGVSATAQKMVQQFRENIIAIDQKIIEELNPLFMGLY